MPAGTKSLLGLGLKFCVKRPRPSNNLDDTCERFRTDVCQIAHFKKHPPEEQPGVHSIPGLYIMNGIWTPPEANKHIEKCLNDFERELRNRQSVYNNKPVLSNLTMRQWRVADHLSDNDDHIAIEADKNLGGCLLDRPVYCTLAVREHLHDTTVYRRLTKKQAINRTRILRYRINVFSSKWQDAISPAEWTYLHEAMFK